jgi:hypothetical protein
MQTLLRHGRATKISRTFASSGTVAGTGGWVRYDQDDMEVAVQ